MPIVVFITAANKLQSRRIAEALVKNKLAACVSLAGKVSSVFWWQGKIDHAAEILLIAKSTKAKMPGIIKLVKSLHSYSVPEIISLPVIGGNTGYLKWIDESTR